MKITSIKRKKYLVMPGKVISRIDNQVHYVDYHSLIRLYQLDPEECSMWPPSRKQSEGFALAAKYDCVVISPDPSGNYPAFLKKRADLPKVRKLWEE